MYCICKFCSAVCAATLGAKSSWEVTVYKNGADTPCRSSNSALEQPAAPAPPTVVTPPPVAVHPPVAVCSVCGDNEVQLAESFKCPNPAAHVLCKSCFENNVGSQIREDLGAFLARNCSIICGFCILIGEKESASFDMQAVGTRRVYTCILNTLSFH